MTDQFDNDALSPAERRAFEQLPREAALPRDLEERVVAALRQRGVFPTPLSVARGGAGRHPHPLKFWIPVAAAAAVAVFMSGLAVGQMIGTQTGVDLAERVGASHTNAVEAAARLQQAGSSYVQALASISQQADSANPAVRDSVRSVAIRVLGQAAEEMALIAPDDPLAAAVLRGINQRQRTSDSAAPSRSVVWY
jgi:hypothetical protein